MSDPFKIEPPFLVLFSGGRTSGCLLRRVLDAYDGVLPENCHVVFNNTGMERVETLDFVERCSQRWGVPVTWLEYTYTPPPDGRVAAVRRTKTGKVVRVVRGTHGYKVVDYATANRTGEPFRQAIMARRALPNIRMRFCTAELKVRTTSRWVKGTLGWPVKRRVPFYRAVIGFRYDEPNRFWKLARRTEYTYGPRKPPEEERTLFGTRKKKQRKPEELSPGEWPVCPLFPAKVTRAGVDAFWAGNDFDLGIPSERGNCTLCFQKGSANLLATIRENPELADWWIEMEKAAEGFARKAEGFTFRLRSDRPPYAELKRIALEGDPQGTLFPLDVGNTPCDDGYCGTY